jgi:hypothetical protein
MYLTRPGLLSNNILFLVISQNIVPSQTVMKAVRGKNDDWDTGNGNEWTTLFLQKKFQPIKRAI